MKITLSKYAGFCEGVQRAFEMVVNIKTNQPVYMLGSLVHNELVVDKLKRRGIKIVKDIKGLKKGILIITAHGIGPGIKEKVKKQGLKVIDTTCPKVVKIHQLARLFKNKNEQIIIFGDKEHTEVKGIKAWAGKNAKVIAGLKEAENLRPGNEKTALVSQTTQDIALFNKIIEILKNKAGKNFEVYDTICQPTKQRQNDIKDLAAKNDIMIIIGSKTSANSRRLFEIALKINKNTHWISNASELNSEWFNKKERGGVSAGASTPDWIIKEVIEKIGILRSSQDLKVLR